MTYMIITAIRRHSTQRDSLPPNTTSVSSVTKELTSLDCHFCVCLSMWSACVRGAHGCMRVEARGQQWLSLWIALHLSVEAVSLHPELTDWTSLASRRGSSCLPHHHAWHSSRGIAHWAISPALVHSFEDVYSEIAPLLPSVSVTSFSLQLF